MPARMLLRRLALLGPFATASAGLLILAFGHRELFDRWAIVAGAGASLIVIGAAAFTGLAELFLAIAALWIYAAVIEAIRGPAPPDRAGLAIIFAGLAAGALVCYVGQSREP